MTTGRILRLVGHDHVGFPNGERWKRGNIDETGTNEESLRTRCSTSAGGRASGKNERASGRLDMTNLTGADSLDLSVRLRTRRNQRRPRRGGRVREEAEGQEEPVNNRRANGKKN
ncbi:uncharacterized protein LOC116433684 isoform X1 [Nomia melanderi]|uniref:uncharacterized protein LOC116433684 isoform X1 n=1 Tax=Nomia melanderi TaxID=2448451 RepID=UPI003FCEBB23